MQLEQEDVNGRRKGDLTPSELDLILQFFTQVKASVMAGQNQKMFILNHSLPKPKAHLLTVLANDGHSEEEQLVYDDNKGEQSDNPFIEHKLEPLKLNQNLLLNIPIGNSVQKYPPFKALVGFCVVDSDQLV